MKTGAIIGGVIGLSVGVGSLIMMGFPHFLSTLFLVDVYGRLLPKGDFGEAAGWLYFMFSTVVGVFYGWVITLLLQKIRK